jgi:hypothetical protein
MRQNVRLPPNFAFVILQMYPFFNHKVDQDSVYSENSDPF